MNTVISVAFAYTRQLQDGVLRSLVKKKNVRGNSHYSFVYLAGFLKQKATEIGNHLSGKGPTYKSRFLRSIRQKITLIFQLSRFRLFFLGEYIDNPSLLFTA